MVSLENITLRFGGTTLFDSVSLMITDKERVGLVGRNGAGKTTLMRIVAGLQEPSTGKVILTSGQKIAYLPQQMKHVDGKSVYDEALSAFDEIIEMENKINLITKSLSQREDYESTDYKRLIEKLHFLNDQLLIHGGKSIHADVEKTLMGLGFRSSDLGRPTAEFSGGWRMRIELAKLLLKKPDFLLLDEPTNHLDIESIEWVESFLEDFAGGIILISHDRVFLDSITKRTVELRLGKMYDFKVPYSKYVELRQERMSQQMAAFRNQQKMISDTEKFINRFRYQATKAVQVQSRIKQLNKFERIEVEDDEPGFLNIKFPPSPRSGKVAIEADNLSKSYEKSLVLDKINILIERGDRVAFVGRNGEGKTTLAKIIMGEIDYKGTLKVGQNVMIGYFAQNQDELLDGNLTVLETIDSAAVGDIRVKIRNILGAFLFSGEDSDKKVKILSGGERSRLSLARMLLQPFNLLVLDEPTNHLDMRSKDILKNALLEFDGTLVVISHDREFLDGLVDKVYEFKNHKVKENLGGIFSFLEKKKLENLRELERKTTIEERNNINTKQEKDNKSEYLRRKELDKKIRKAKSELEKIEATIEDLEKKIKEMELLMSVPENISDNDLFKEYKKLKTKHDHLLYEWEILHENHEKLIQ